MILAAEGLLALLAVLFVCQAYGAETKLPVEVTRKINLIRADFESKRATLALRKTELSEQHKNDPQVHFALGVLLASQGQSKPAQLELEKADALQPRTFEIPYGLGQTLLLNGKYPHAEIVLNRALALKPESPETLYLLAQALANESRPMDALALLVQQQDCGFVSGHDFSRATPRPKWFRL